MIGPPVGYRLRQRRRQRGLTQVSLARAVGISASYLNLIEHGKRDVAGGLLHRLADALELEVAEVTGTEASRLVQDLTEITADPLLRDLAIDSAGAQEIVGRQPGWGRAVVRLHRSYRGASVLAETLAERLAHDPNLLEASHELLTRMTSIRSFAEILRKHSEIEPARRERYTALIAEESSKLGDIAKAVFERLSDFGDSARPTTPAEEVDDFIIDRRSFFAELEEAAGALARRMGLGDIPAEAEIASWLTESHGIRIETVDGSEAMFDALRHGAFDAGARAFRIPAGLPAPTRRFQLARLAFSLEAAAPVAELVRDPRLTSDAARERTTRALYSYGAGALVLPYDAVLKAAGQVGYDLDRLEAIFGASTEQICHRLVTLRRPGAEGIPFAFMRVDPAGNISKRYSLPTLPLPRYGGACPLWAVYRTQQTPGALVTQRVRLPDGREFLFMARTVAKPSPSFGVPGETFSVMIACEAVFAGQIVYGEALRGAAGLTLEAGINCHLCPREGCAQRAFPQVKPAAALGV
jgi:predicted transcriptional regulator/transcriptional regulator with XRE-family HTH domain